MSADVGRVQAVEQPTQLAVAKLKDLLDALRPGEPVLLQPFLPEAEPVVVPVEHLDDCPGPVAEDEEIAREDIKVEMVGHHDGETVDRLAHVGVAEHHEHPDAGIQREHQSFTTSRISRSVCWQNPGSTSRR